MTAKKVMTDIPPGERYVFVAGMLEGLALARYYKDGKQRDGMRCMLDWFYDDKQTVQTIYAAFNKYPDYPPASIVDVLAKQKCGG